MKDLEKRLTEAERVASQNMDGELYKKIFSMLDLTSLNSTDTEHSIAKMVEKVNSFPLTYSHIPQVAAICVYPNFASTVKSHLKDGSVKVAAVGGVFPSSQSFLEIKVAECKMAVENGADEVDIVLSLNHFLRDDMESAAGEIIAIKEAIGGACLKVILESGVLNDLGMIYRASILAMDAGADFIKTSTGKCQPAATPQAAVVMCTAIKDYYQKSGRRVGFKPAGGVSTPKESLLYYSIVQTILGFEWLNRELFRIGASRLANNLIGEIEKKEIKYY